MFFCHCNCCSALHLLLAMPQTRPSSRTLHVFSYSACLFKVCCCPLKQGSALLCKVSPVECLFHPQLVCRGALVLCSRCSLKTYEVEIWLCMFDRRISPASVHQRCTPRTRFCIGLFFAHREILFNQSVLLSPGRGGASRKRTVRQYVMRSIPGYLGAK